ncbi:MAG TPA: hypothetical protein PLZ98_11565, partial [Chitinophagaceae bacterium]|nr:hypothetical protein [Chitinophagaceae bacterium]
MSKTNKSNTPTPIEPTYTKETINTPLSTPKPLLTNLLLFSFIAVFVAMTAMSFFYGLSGDEVDMNEYGKTILKYFTSFGSDQSVFRTSDEL